MTVLLLCALHLVQHAVTEYTMTAALQSIQYSYTQTSVIVKFKLRLPLNFITESFTVRKLVAWGYCTLVKHVLVMSYSRLVLPNQCSGVLNVMAGTALGSLGSYDAVACKLL